MTRTYLQKLAAGLTMVATSATMSGCSAGYTTNNTSTVLLIVAFVNGGVPLQSDVVTGGVVVSNSVGLEIAVRFKNPNITTTPSVPSAVILERYEVTYRRSDGRGVQGQDVPFSISGNITAAFDVKNDGTDALTLEVVRAQAKLEPPLRNLRGATSAGGFGGALVVTMFADIVVHGRTVSGQPVSGQGSLQIDFADYAD
jgi:hypothetical protein